MHIPTPLLEKTVSLHPPIIFILVFEACQRFSNYGILGLLYQYIDHELAEPRNMAIGKFHLILSMWYMSGVVCTMLTDTCVRKKRLTLVCCLITIVADGLLVYISTLPCREYDRCQWIAYLVLLMHACGAGGLRDTMRTLGADQFKLPSEEMHLRNYFQMFHYALTLGMVLAYLIPPILRTHTYCNQDDYCFTIGFLVPACFMLIALASLLIGWRFLKPLPPWGSCIAGFIWVLYSAMRNRHGRVHGKRDFLDKAKRDFRAQFVVDVRATLRVLRLFIPLPVLWAIIEQVHARFVDQASRMDGTLDKYGQYSIEPEHMQVVIPVVVLIMMPLADHWLVPLFRHRCKICGPKTRFAIGGTLVCGGMLVAGFTEMFIKTYDLNLPPARETMLIFINMHDYCDVTFRASFVQEKNKIIHVPHNSLVYREDIKVRVPRIFNYSLEFHEPHDLSVPRPDNMQGDYPCLMNYTGTSKLRHSHLTTLVSFNSLRLKTDSKIERIGRWPTDDLPFGDPEKCDLQLPKVALVYSRDLSNEEQQSYRVEFTNERRNYSFQLDPNRFGLPFVEFLPGRYRVHQENLPRSMDAYREYYLGAVYIEQIKANGDPTPLNGSELASPNQLRMEWQLIQNTMMAVGLFLYPELLLEYSYTQVPVRMKPMLLTVWQLSLAAGNMLVALLSYSQPFSSSVSSNKNEVISSIIVEGFLSHGVQTIGRRYLVWPYFAYFGMMFFDLLVLASVLYSYKHTNKYLPRLMQVRPKRKKLDGSSSSSMTVVDPSLRSEDGDGNDDEDREDQEDVSDESSSSSEPSEE